MPQMICGRQRYLIMSNCPAAAGQAACGQCPHLLYPATIQAHNLSRQTSIIITKIEGPTSVYAYALKCYAFAALYATKPV